MALFDGLMRSVAPVWSAKRAVARVQLAEIERYQTKLAGRPALRFEKDGAPAGPIAKIGRQMTAWYDAATRSYRTSGRRIGQTSADKESYYSLARLRDISRELVRNNAYAKRAVSAIANNVVGDGITASVQVPLKPDGTPTASMKALKASMQRLITAHLLTTDIDFDGRHNLYGQQNLAMRTMAESGEVLIVRYRPPARLRLKVPLQIRVMEPDYLNPWMDSLVLPESGNYVVQGIEYDQSGRRVAYHLFDQHPGSFVSYTWKSRRVPAEDVIHLYRVDRPGQSRGIPWGAPVFMRLWDLGDFTDAELMRQKIAACFAMFVVDNGGTTTLGAAANQGKTETGDAIDMLEPGTVQRLPPGTDVKFATPPTVQGFEHYLRATVREIGIGFDVPYEVISYDLSQVNFSSGRMGWLEFHRNITTWQGNIFIPHFCDGVAKWFLEVAEFVIPNAAACSITWTPPRREMIDPTKEIPAMRDAIRAGLLSLPEALRMLGYDPETVLTEIKESADLCDLLGIRLDSDGRFAVGSPMVPTSKDVKLPGDPQSGAGAGK